MRVRRAHAGDLDPAVRLARSLGLEYPGMGDDELWVAEEKGRIVGLVALKKHSDCLELCALGVDPDFRGKGAAKALVAALMAETPGDVHLATIIPAFFESCGFEVVRGPVPETFPAKRRTAWCEGCPQERCTIMRKKKP